MSWLVSGMNPRKGVTMWEEIHDIESKNDLLSFLPGFLEKYVMVSIVGDSK